MNYGITILFGVVGFQCHGDRHKYFGLKFLAELQSTKLVFHRRYAYLCLFLSDRVGGYVFFLLFYRTGAACPISAHLAARDAGIPHRVSGPSHAHLAAGRSLADLHRLRCRECALYHNGCRDSESTEKVQVEG